MALSQNTQVLYQEIDALTQVSDQLSFCHQVIISFENEFQFLENQVWLIS